MKKPDEDTDAMDLVPFYRGSAPAEAEIVRLVLEDAGILAVIPDRNTAFPVDLTPLDGHHSPAGSEVHVPVSDLARAREALEEARAAGREIAEGEIPG
jgi:hypothetical protein